MVVFNLADILQKKMPVQTPQWTEFLTCPICCKLFDSSTHRPISLACAHTICQTCLSKLQQKKCPFDQNQILREIDQFPVNNALLQLVGTTVPEEDIVDISKENLEHYELSKQCIETLALYLKPSTSGSSSPPATIDSNGILSNGLLSRPMQRKLVVMVSCQLVEEEGRARAMRAARSLGERTVTELILQHQNPQQLSSNLWAAVRARGCQFLGPAMQEEVLRLILLALEDGSALSRKVLVLFVVQRLETHYPQASKTAIGHVVQLLYRASCFMVTKREEESSLMQLKEECRVYDSLRREHDSQIVQIAMEAGLRIAPDQWSSLLYGDTSHKSHMQSIIDKLQTPQSFSQSVNELVIALQRTGDPCNLQRLRLHLEFLANIDPSPDAPSPSWENLAAVMKAMKNVVQGLVDFIQSNGHKKIEAPALPNSRYKTSLCRDYQMRNTCPRGINCTFAHSQDELERYRSRNKKTGKPIAAPITTSLASKDKVALDQVSKIVKDKLDETSKTADDGGHVELGRSQVSSPSASLSQKMEALAIPKKPLPVLTQIDDNSPIPRVTAGLMPPVPPPGYRGMGQDMFQHPVVTPRQNTMNPHITYEQQGYPVEGPVAGYQQGPYGMPYPQPPYTSHPPPRAPHYPSSLPYRPQVHYRPPMRYMHPYDIPRYQSGLNPYAEPWPHAQGAMPMHPEEQMYGVRMQGYQDRYNTFPPQTPMAASGQASLLNDLHHRRNEILNRLQNPVTHMEQASPDIMSGKHDRPNISTGSGSGKGDHLYYRCGDDSSIRTDSSARSGTFSGNNRSRVSEQHTQYCLGSGKHLDGHSGFKHKTLFRGKYGKGSNVYCQLDIPGTSKNTSTVSNASEAPALDTGCAVWSTDGVDDVVWNVTTDSQAGIGSGADDSSRWTEDTIDATEFMLNWLQDIPDEPTPIDLEPRPSEISQSSRRYGTAFDYSEDDSIIPWGPPIVSKFGPISRSSRAKYKNTEPIQVTADDDTKKMLPVTAVTPGERPQPTAMAQQSLFHPPQLLHMTDNPQADSLHRWTTEEENRVQMQLARLEEQALKANTENEFLTCELKAVELQISLQTDKSMMTATVPPPPVPPAPTSQPETRAEIDRYTIVKQPSGTWSSFDLLAAAYTKGVKIDELRQMAESKQHIEVAQGSTDREECLMTNLMERP